MFRCMRCIARRIKESTFITEKAALPLLTSRVYVNTVGVPAATRKIVSGSHRHSVSEYCARSHTCGQLSIQHVGQAVTICGWLQYTRMDGHFITLRDAYGTTQVTINSHHNAELREKIGQLNYESVLEVEGTVVERPAGQFNKRMSTGEIEVVATNITILSHCVEKQPFQVHNFHKVGEALRMQYRYLDLRNEEMQRNLRLRSRVLLNMRNFLCNMHGFVDVETPTLFRRTPGGAREFVVPTHTPGMYYSLPQSPQQFKQLLMVGGMDRYMQIAKCYRDETARPDRQPEFTQLDLEMSFVTETDVMSLVEDLLDHCWPEGIPITRPPFPRLTYTQAIGRYGTDKPDTRFHMTIHDVTRLLEDSTFQVLIDACESYPLQSIHAINFKQAGKCLTNKQLNELKDSVKEISSAWCSLCRVKEGGHWQGSLAHKLGPSTHEALTSQLALKPGDLLMLTAGCTTDACKVLGRLRLSVADTLETIGERVRDKAAMELLWVHNFPLFLPREDGHGLESAHHPFTAPKSSDTDLLHTHPEKVEGQHYDLVLNGSEIGGGSIRVHDASLQRYILGDILKEDVGPLEHLLQALDCGAPPHGGIALGIDRLIATLCGAGSIRDVIAFPKSGNGKDLMARAPATVTPLDTLYYHLKP